MVENGEDAYPLNNLSLFPIEFDHQRGKKKKNKSYGENWHLWFIPMSRKYYKTSFVLQGVPKSYKKLHFWSPLFIS